MIYILSALRSILVSPIIVISVVICGSIAAIVCTLTSGNRFYPTFFTVSWCRFVIWISGVEIKVTGRENTPQASCLYVFNHSSHYDIPVINSQITNHIRFGGKSSLFKIPFFGQAMKSFGTIRISRGEREKVIKEYSKSLIHVKEQGVSIILAAEGTRNPKPPQMMPFKSGPFILAIQGQLPIVPIVLGDVYKVLPKYKLFMPFGPWKRKTTLQILKPVSTQGLTFDDRTDLKNKIRVIMEEYI